jgi:hypothetical protein
MRRRTTHLCLILALGGPLLSQASLAASLAHLMSEVRAIQNFMEEDPDEAEACDELSLVAVPSGAQDGPGQGLVLASGFGTPAPSHASVLLPADSGAGWNVRWRPPWPPPTAVRRHALLQIFLF